MTSYDHLTYLQTFLMTLIAAFTNLAAIPLAIKLIKRASTSFEGFIVIMSIFTSFMYHICEIYNCEIFLNQLQWHRLDNIFAITSFELVILHGFGSIADEDVTMRWSALLSSVIIQEKDPWNLAYTVTPCILYIFISIAYRLYNLKSRKVTYDKQKMRIAVIIFAIGIYFFYLGLDDPNDYLRIFHGIWHICASIFGYYCISSVRVIVLSGKQKWENETESNALQF